MPLLAAGQRGALRELSLAVVTCKSLTTAMKETLRMRNGKHGDFPRPSQFPSVLRFLAHDFLAEHLLTRGAGNLSRRFGSDK